MAAAAHFDGVCIGITLHCLGEIPNDVVKSLSRSTEEY